MKHNYSDQAFTAIICVCVLTSPKNTTLSAAPTVWGDGGGRGRAAGHAAKDAADGGRPSVT